MSEKKINENETVISRYNYLCKIFKNNVALVHGKMKKEEIDSSMKSLLKKKMILFPQTVIEVRINVPSATLIIIEDAHRFGLSQLRN